MFGATFVWNVNRNSQRINWKFFTAHKVCVILTLIQVSSVFNIDALIYEPRKVCVRVCTLEPLVCAYIHVSVYPDPSSFNMLLLLPVDFFYGYLSLVTFTRTWMPCYSTAAPPAFNGRVSVFYASCLAPVTTPPSSAAHHPLPWGWRRSYSDLLVPPVHKPDDAFLPWLHIAIMYFACYSWITFHVCVCCMFVLLD